ncbi:MAG: hypothetical protein LAD29_03815 [Rhodoferax sp.]|nr:hypothetical protein [Rhodoferax sp.]
MKNFFSLVNLTIGLLFLLVGSGIFASISRTPANAGAALVALLIAAVCLWLAKQSAFEGKAQLP